MYINLIEFSDGIEFDVSPEMIKPQTAFGDVYHASYRIEDAPEEVVWFLETLLKSIGDLEIKDQVNAVKERLFEFLIQSENFTHH